MMNVVNRKNKKLDGSFGGGPTNRDTYLTFCFKRYPSHQIITEIEQARCLFITGSFWSFCVSHQKIQGRLKKRRIQVNHDDSW